MVIKFEGTIQEIVEEMNLFLMKEYSKNETSKDVNLPQVILPKRNKKQLTQFELDFIVENYRKKSIEWIAAKLSRSKTKIYQ